MMRSNKALYHFNYAFLHGQIKEKYNTQENFAVALGIGRVSLSQRLNNKLAFSQDEILRAVKLLGLKNEQIAKCFFTVYEN